jgi:hypothetical protein
MFELFHPFKETVIKDGYHTGYTVVSDTKYVTSYHKMNIRKQILFTYLCTNYPLNIENMPTPDYADSLFFSRKMGTSALHVYFKTCLKLYWH